MTAITTNHKTTKYSLSGTYSLKHLNTYFLSRLWTGLDIWVKLHPFVLSVFRDFSLFNCYLLNITCFQSQCTGQGTCVPSRFSRVRLRDPMDCSPRDSPGKNLGEGSCFLLQGIFPTQGLNLLLLGLLQCRAITFHFCPLLSVSSFLYR